MVTDLSYRVEIKGWPIVRDTDGLALSSRNVYLTENQRKEALNIPKSLLKAHKSINSGERNPTAVKQLIIAQLEKSSEIGIDYVELVNGETLKVADQIGDETRVLIAVKIGAARLIDNMSALNGPNI